MSDAVRDRVAALVDSHGARVLSALARQFRDIELAEEAAQEAWTRALAAWPDQGVPDRPVAWVFATARNHCLDVLRRRRSATTSLPIEPDADPSDDRVALLFAVCHPALDPRVQVGLALRTLCGLDNREIARAFLTTEVEISRRLSLAAAKIRDAGIPFEVPGPGRRAERLAGVLASVYLVFNEGFAPTHVRGLRPRLCEDAIRLGETVRALLPEAPEVGGLVALMRLNHARRDARFDAEGRPVLLERQDRSRWHRQEIDAALVVLDDALGAGAAGPYQIQASIAALHARALSSDETDWAQIAALYGLLLRHQPSPVVELNAAVALAMARGPEHGLTWLARIEERGTLRGYHLLPAARAGLLLRQGDLRGAAAAYDEAIRLASSPNDRTQLASLRAACGPTRRRRRARREPRSAGLSDRQWERVRGVLPERRRRGRPGRPDREILEAVLWVLATGAPWRELPDRYGPWQTAYHRFRLWERDGTLARVVERLRHHAAGAAFRSLTPLPPPPDAGTGASTP